MRISTVTDTKHAGSWLTVKWRVPLFLWSEKGRRGVSRQACGAPKVIARPCVTCSPINVASYVGYESETPTIPISLSPRKSELEEAFVSLLYPASSPPSPDLVQISRGTRSLRCAFTEPNAVFDYCHASGNGADSSGCARFPARWVNGLSPRLPFHHLARFRAS